jgi:beta-glucosidase
MIPIYRDPKQSIEARTDDLLSRMTLEEKVAQLGSAWVYELLTGGVWDKDKVEKTLDLGIGQISRVGGASSLRPLDSARLANRIQR